MTQPRRKSATLAWGWPALSKKAHVFSDGRALCGKWLFGGALDPVTVPAEGETIDRGPDDCAGCHKKLVAHFKTAPKGLAVEAPEDGACTWCARPMREHPLESCIGTPEGTPS